MVVARMVVTRMVVTRMVVNRMLITRMVMTRSSSIVSLHQLVYRDSSEWGRRPFPRESPPGPGHRMQGQFSDSSTSGYYWRPFKACAAGIRTLRQQYIVTTQACPARAS